MSHAPHRTLSLTLTLALTAGCGGNQLSSQLGVANANGVRPAVALPGEASTAGDATGAAAAPLASPPGPVITTSDGEDLTSQISFPTSENVPVQVDQKLATGMLTQTLTMTQGTVTKTQQATQVQQPAVEDDFQQGPADKNVTDTFVGSDSRPVDVLLVLDTGCHMEGLDQSYPEKLAPLLGAVAGTDWQIGVVTTNPDDSCIRQVVKSGDANAAAELAQAVSVAENGNDNPRGILQAVRSLAGTCQPKPWIRANSQLEVVFVSNEDNCIDGQGCQGKAYASADYLSDYLATIRTVGKTARVHSVVMPRNVQACDCRLGLRPGNTYLDLVRATSGAAGSICDQDYAPVLAAIGADAAATLRSSFTLSAPPIDGTLSVQVGGVPLTTGFTLAGNVLTLAAPLADGATLTVSYETVVTNPQTTFQLRYPPVAGSVNVTVNGTALAATAYTVDPTALTVTFAAAPAPNAKIAVTYTRDVPLTTQFQLNAAPIAGTLAVTVNGTATTAFTLDSTTNTVTFTQAPPPQAALTFTYTALGDPVLSYPLALGATAPAGLTVVDAKTSAAVAYTYQNGTLSFATADFQNGRQLLVSWPNTARDSFTITLANTPVAGSVVATAGAVSCSTAPELVVTGSTVQVASCPFATSATDVLINYSYLQYYQQFIFSVPNLPGPNDFQIWTVAVNGVVTTNYVQTGNVFTFPQGLPANGTVAIQLVQLAL